MLKISKIVEAENWLKKLCSKIAEISKLFPNYRQSLKFALLGALRSMPEGLEDQHKKKLEIALAKNVTFGHCLEVGKILAK